VTSKLVLGFEPSLHDTSLDAPEGPLFSIDYVDIVDPGTFERVWEPTPDSLIIAAARLKDVRLIDNLVLGPFSEPSDHTEDHTTGHTTDPSPDHMTDQEAATPSQARTTEKEG
jgi:hypothetical protein